MTQNPSNALILLGHSNGSLSMCTPRDPPNKPVVSMFAHKGPLKTIAVDPSGHYVATAGIEGTVKVWDVRTYGCVGSIGGMDGLSTMQISQKGMLAVGIRNQVRVYRHSTDIGNLYMKHNVTGTVRSVSFCPYEDTLAIGHAHGVSSILIPGSGEPSFDSRTPNPYSTDQFIKDWNVRSLLDKLPYDSICLDDGIIGTSGRRATDYNYDPQVKVTDELKQELSAIGVKQSGKKRKVSSRDQLREELAARDQQTKDEVGGDWWDRSEDALERFGTLKRRKLKHELQKRKDVKDTLDESEAQDATEDMQDKVETVGGSLRSLLEDNDDQVIRVSKGKVVEDASEEEDDDDEEDGGNDNDDDDEVGNQEEDSDSSEEEQDRVEEPDGIVDPFAGFD
jgi:U3 small nucleolar RNA-associated protein 7